MEYPKAVGHLIDELRRLPGIGPKSAQRIVFHLLKTNTEDVSRLSKAVGALLVGIRTCSLCNAITDQEICITCSNPARLDHLICVVEEPHDLLAVERTREYKGRYHVLHGALSPLQGIGPDELRIQGLLDRVRKGPVSEVILATSPTVEGEATAVYLHRLLKLLTVRVTRIAMGIPVGSDLDWADEVTIAKAIEGRREYV